MNQLFSTIGQVLVMVSLSPNIRVREIARRLDVTERTVVHALKHLADNGLIEIQRLGRTNRYSVSDTATCKVGGASVRLGDLISVFRRP